MDDDRVEGAAKNIGGKVKDAIGSVLGDAGLQAQGARDQVSGRIQNAYGSAKDVLGGGAGGLAEQIEDFVHEQPIAALLGAATLGFLLARLINR